MPETQSMEIENHQLNTAPSATAEERPVAASTPTVQAVKSIAPVPTEADSPSNPGNQGLSRLVCDDDWCVYEDGFPLTYPIRSKTYHLIDRSYTYGSTQVNNREQHHGVEFPYPYGTPVVAAADGVVIAAGDDSKQVYGLYPGFYGNFVIIEHQLQEGSQLIYTLYAHLSEVNTKIGARVKAGAVIGKVGASGSAIGSHLHFEVRLKKNAYQETTNPILWIKPQLDTTINQLTGTVVLQNNTKLELASQQVVIEQFGSNPSVPDTVYYGETYAAGVEPNPRFGEIYALSELAPGDYRMGINVNGIVVKQPFSITAGKLTLIPLNNP